MKLLFDGSTLAKGGGVQAAEAFLLAMTTSELEWLAILPENIKDFLDPRIQDDDRIRYCRKTILADYFRIHRILKNTEREFEPTVVYTLFGPPYFRAQTTHVCGFARPQFFYRGAHETVMSRILNRLKRAIHMRLFLASDVLVFETELAETMFRARWGNRNIRTAVIGNTINPRIKSVKSDVVTDNDGEWRVLVPSAYYKHKNLEILPSVAAAMRGNGWRNFAFRLTLSACEAKPILDSASRLGVREHFLAIGKKTTAELGEEYTMSTCVLLPTRMEMSTAVYPEAFWFERPLITTNLDFARTQCGDAAMYCDPDSPHEFASAIEECHTNCERRKSLIHHGRKMLTRYPEPDEKFQQQLQLLVAVQ
jgi:glycosyltransferase involved in cell wall biosynthesis